MVVAKKKTAAKKTTAKKAVKASSNGSDEKLGKEIAALRDDGVSWADIADQIGIKAGKAMFLHMCATVKPSERIKYTDDDDLAKKVVAARDKEQLSWGTIMARTGVGGAKLRSLYEKASGTATLGQRIGRGGRPPGGAAKRTAAKKSGTKKTAAKKGAAKKRAAKEGPRS